MAPRKQNTPQAQQTAPAPTLQPVDAGIKRTDGIIIVSSTNGNTNGDPDKDGAARQNPYTMKGMISPMAPKRRIRDNIERMGRASEGYDIFIARDAALEDAKKAAIEAATKLTDDPKHQTILAEQRMLETYADIRIFGALLGANKDHKLSNFRGAVNIYWG